LRKYEAEGWLEAQITQYYDEPLGGELNYELHFVEDLDYQDERLTSEEFCVGGDSFAVGSWCALIPASAS
jgi:hypothetical protein